MPFVIGAPRSGTTMLRLMLDSHPDLAIPPETGFAASLGRLRGDDDRLRGRFLRAIVRHPTWPDFCLDRGALASALDGVRPFTVADGLRAFYRLYAGRFGKTRWGDKTPLYCLEIDLLRRILPEARFIHLIRDGRDAAMSLRQQWFSPGDSFRTQARYWVRAVTAGRQSGLGHEDYLEVRYEDLILAPRDTLRTICFFVDLTVDEEMFDYHLRASSRIAEHKGRRRAGRWLVTAEDRARQQARTTLPPDPSRVFAWRREMSEDDRGEFESVAGSLLAELGYEL